MFLIKFKKIFVLFQAHLKTKDIRDENHFCWYIEMHAPRLRTPFNFAPLWTKRPLCTPISWTGTTMMCLFFFVFVPEHCLEPR